MADSSHTYPTISASQSAKEVTANSLILAGSPSLLFGIDTRTTAGLNFGYLGGKYRKADGTVITKADATLTLTASATNYILETNGVVSVVTSAPAGWPGPLAGGATALYDVITSSVTATSYMDYRTTGTGASGGGSLTDGDYGDVTVSGSGAAIAIDANVVTYAKMQDVSAASKLIGRGAAAGAGDPQEITVGSGLTMTGTTLSASGGTGTVTSVALTVPSHLSVAGSPVTTSGTLAISYSGTALPVANGGTGDTSLTAYAPVFGGTTSTGALQSGTVGTAGQVLTSNGAGALPTFQAAAGGGSGDSIVGTTGATGGNATATGGTSTTSGNAGGKVIVLGGTPGATGVGGEVQVTGGPGGTTSGTSGAVTVTGGTSTNGAGGAVNVSGGLGGSASTTYAGGAVLLTGGHGTASASAFGGDIVLAGGNSLGASNHGIVILKTGTSANSNTPSNITVNTAITVTGSTGQVGGVGGGTISIIGGSAGNGTTTAGGSVTITGGTAGSGNAASVAGALLLKGGPGGAIAGSPAATATLQGGAGTATGTGSAGANAIVQGGAAGGSGNNKGGNVVLTPGVATGTGGAGHVVLNGSGSALATTATGGYTCLPTCAGTPTGVPANIPTGTVPMVVDTTGSKLWLYIGGTWKGVVVA